MQRYRLLALDIDGTLVNSRHELTEPTRAAILRAKQAGLVVVLATGRRYSRVLPLAEALEIDVPVVTASGALIKHPADHRTVFRAAFKPGVLERMLAIVAQAQFDAVLYADSYGQGFDYYCRSSQADEPLLAEFLSLNAGSERVAENLMSAPPDGIFAGFAIGSLDAMLDLEAQLSRSLAESLYVHVLRSPRYRGYMCEIAPGGVSKWAGVCRLADQWDIAADEICAVGDDVNDIPMIRGAGLGVAMSNALNEVKAAADRIAPGHDADGLAEVVRWLIES